MDQHQRIGPAHVLRRQHLHIGLPLHDLLAGLADIFAADIEVAALGDGRLVERGHRQLRRLGAHGRRDGNRRQQHGDEAQCIGHGFLPAAAFVRQTFACVATEGGARLAALSICETMRELGAMSRVYRVDPHTPVGSAPRCRDEAEGLENRVTENGTTTFEGCAYIRRHRLKTVVVGGRALEATSPPCELIWEAKKGSARKC